MRPGTRQVPTLAFSRRRRRRAPLTALTALVVAGGALAAWTGVTDQVTSVVGRSAEGEPRDVAPSVRDTVADRSEGEQDAGPPAEQPDLDDATAPLARLGDLPILLPAPDPVVVGFHEAATVSAIGVTPVGALTEDRNTTRTQLAEDVVGGTPYLVLTSRGRSAGPTSAIDVVMREGDPVLAPVTGTVVDVRSYLLYGAHQDLRIELVPDGRPDVRLVMIHIDGPRVAIGDRVVGGVTPVAATARLFSFGSHIDRETEPERFPHVHIELQPVDGPRPGDDAEDADEREDGPDA